jgi:excisionase family DNA binding protein
MRARSNRPRRSGSSRKNALREFFPQPTSNEGLGSSGISEIASDHDYRLLRRKAIPAFKMGSDYRFNRESIDSWRSKSSAQVKRPIPEIKRNKAKK